MAARSVAEGESRGAARSKSGFLQLWDREILQDAGKVTAELAKAHAESEFEKYRIVQDRLFESDFDRLLKQLPEKGGKP